jgi:hypothetical protein
MLFKNAVRTSKRTQHLTITRVNRLMLLKGISKSKAVPLYTMEALGGRDGPRFTPGERTPGTHCTGGWVGPRAGLETEVRRKILCPCRGSNPDRPVVQSVARHYTV